MKSFAQLLINSRSISLLVFTGLFFGNSCQADNSPPVIDQRPALEIDAFQVSQYLVDKYHGRFANGLRQQEHRIASAIENRNWLDLFVAKQIVIAHINSLGYLDRPEITKSVMLMERHMLTQAEGPFYQRIFSQQPPLSNETLKQRYRNMSGAIDVMVARFRDEEAALAGLGEDFERCTVEEQSRRIRKCAGREGVEITDKSMSWPFEPVSEIGDFLINVPNGRWTKHHESGFGLYYVFKRSATNGPDGDFQKDGKDFTNYANYVERQVIQRRRYNALLASAAFSLDDKLAGRMSAICEGLIAVDEQLPDGPFSELDTKTLFLFHAGPETMEVTVKGFRDHFNGLFIRHVPRSAPDITALAKSLAVEELDVRAAREQGIDRTPQFVEDRKGYAGLLALDLFEREVLLPGITITPTEIERYYAAHSAQFVQTNKIRGHILRFDAPEKALAWQQKQLALSKTGSIALAEISGSDQDRELELAHGENIPGLESYQRFLFECPEGTVLGPVRQGENYLCFLKQRNVETAPVAPTVSNPAIRRLLERQALDTRERSLAAELANHLNVKNHIDYTHYETAGLVWAAQPTQ